MTDKDRKIKIHLGCGAVYLEGYENLDVPVGKFYFADERPDLVKENITTLDNYYKDPYYNNYYERFILKLKKAKKIPPPRGTPSKDIKRRKVVVDKTAYADHLPFKRGSVDEIRCVQVFEHLSPDEVRRVLMHWKEILKSGEKLVIDVPDVVETAKLMAMAETEEERAWAEKLLHGTRNDSFAYHKAGYWPEKLKRILEDAGFKHIKQGKNFHSYPAFSMEATKVDKAIVVTTINKPTKEIGEYTPLQDWNVISVGDTKTPEDWRLEDITYLSPSLQDKLFPEFSKVLPWKSYSRKNMGYLYAVEMGSKVIAEIDDDIAPYKSYPPNITKEKSVKVVSGPKFVNIYKLFGETETWPRGFPVEHANKNDEKSTTKTQKVFAPIQNSLLDHDGDFDAIYRLVSNKKVNFKKSGEFAIGQGSYCPFHSGNTFWHPEAYPLLYLPAFANPHVEDIWRGYIAQRILWEMGANLLFIYPTAYTDNRNPHDYNLDFKNELPLYLETNKLIKILDSLSLSKDPTASLLKTYEEIVKEGILPMEELSCLNAWINELERLL